ncbi:hypothetical protein [Pantoea ananatis]|nr:hypothetical protein [Pantoea ananatis]
MNFNKDNGSLNFGNGLFFSSTLNKKDLFLIDGFFGGMAWQW